MCAAVTIGAAGGAIACAGWRTIRDTLELRRYSRAIDLVCTRARRSFGLARSSSEEQRAKRTQPRNQRARQPGETGDFNAKIIALLTSRSFNC